MGRKTNDSRVVSDFYDVTEAAIYMKVAKGTVYQLIYKQSTTKIPVRYNGRKPIFLIEELKQWMLQRTAWV